MQKLFCLVLVLICFQSFSQGAQPPDGYYVVVGSFSIKKNAEQFTRKLNKSGIACRYIFHEEKKLNYVFTHVYQQVDSAKNEVIALRNKPEFFDAWLKKFPEDGAGNYQHTLTDTSNNNFELAMMVHLFNAVNLKPIPGNVNVIDPEALKPIQALQGNKREVLKTKRCLDQLLLLCNIFGYRKIEYKLELPVPSDTTSHIVHKSDSAWVIEFGLEPFRRGDIESLYNVYFYNDASIMREDSKYQLQELVTLLKENPEMKIKLHGHTNGNYFGRLISASKDDNLFSLTKDVVKTIGSAKTLAHKRTLAVKNYLKANGISEERIDVKAWGGSRPLYHRHSHRAKLNLRVDVEIL